MSIRYVQRVLVAFLAASLQFFDCTGASANEIEKMLYRPRSLSSQAGAGTEHDIPIIDGYPADLLTNN